MKSTALRILIADDAPLNLQLLRVALEAQGHTVVDAANGVEALAILDTEPFDAVISDILMPVMDGYRLCSEIRRGSGGYQGIPLILYTATYDSPADRRLAAGVGADAFVLKSAPVAVLLAALHDAVHKTGARQVVAAPHDEAGMLKLYNDALVRKLEARNVEIQESLAALRVAHDAIVESNQLLESRVAQRTVALDRANQELEAFSFSVSHDLQSPVRRIDGLARHLQSFAASQLDGKNMHSLGQIIAAAAHMTQLINALLAFARSSRSEMHFGEVDLNLLVDQCIAGLHFETSGRIIEWKRSALPTVHGDETLLHQVMANLLSNAVKYSAPRDHAVIEVGARENRDHEVVIFVRDNGVGFDQRYAAKLFGVFQRMHRADEFEGTGIGLANAQRIITRHGGAIWADATLGAGACFSFSLPR